MDFLCSGSRADWFPPLPSPFLGSPSSTGSEAPQCSRPKCHPALGRIQHFVQTVQGSAFRTARQLLCSFLKISSEKQTGFVSFHPVYTHKKISTLYKEQQQYNLNMHPATNHIYRETGLYKQNRSTLLHQNSGGVSGGNDGRSSDRRRCMLLLKVICSEMSHNTPTFL